MAKNIKTSNITIKELQNYIKEKDYKPGLEHGYFLKLAEKVGELAEVIRKDKRIGTKETQIKGTVEEELSDVFYYVLALANLYNIALGKSFQLKEKINKERYTKDKKMELETKTRIETYVKEKKWTPKNYYWKHAFLTRKLALELQKEVGGDKNIIEAATLLHDVGKAKLLGPGHEKYSAKMAKDLLNKLDFPKEKIPKVLECIEYQNFSSL